MNVLDNLSNNLHDRKKTWLVTGVAGFIGSNIAEFLLSNNQKVIGVDDFSTGRKKNLDSIENSTGNKFNKNFIFHNIDISKLEIVKHSLSNVDYVLHQAALGSVPRSIKDPISTNHSNISGFLNIIHISKLIEVKNFIYAGSSSTYGDHKDLPKVEEKIGKPLSPYAVTKYVNELYADIYFKTFDFNSIGLRYFNVFGRRQDPDGSYAAVIPKWIQSMISGNDIFIYGDGETSRDFCYIDNVIQANILSALKDKHKGSSVYNVAVGERISLNELFLLLKKNLEKHNIFYTKSPIYKDFRDGDVRHSKADISKISRDLGYFPQYDVTKGIEKSISWYVDYFKN